VMVVCRSERPVNLAQVSAAAGVAATPGRAVTSAMLAARSRPIADVGSQHFEWLLTLPPGCPHS
jgi:hypothetical protein